MSSAEMTTSRQQTECCPIPSRRVVLNDPSQLPLDYSTTPGGTLYSTTPGGSKIIYDRKFLMECRNSPYTRTPPRFLPNIPGVTSPLQGRSPTGTAGSPAAVPASSPNPSTVKITGPLVHQTNHVAAQEDKGTAASPTAIGDDAQFEMDI
uniref:eukaryotic translation initiation factor 4E-binding protein 1-like n=1 Tax=Myxine glutinosa TaxID=7769 RepID=UPI00358F5927